MTRYADVLKEMEELGAVGDKPAVIEPAIVVRDLSEDVRHLQEEILTGIGKLVEEVNRLGQLCMKMEQLLTAQKGRNGHA
jgi:hypothetical protein